MWAYRKNKAKGSAKGLRRGRGPFARGAPTHIAVMSSFFGFLMIVAMLAVVASLLIGLFAMARGGEFNARYGNRFMRARVILQGLAIVFFVLAMITSH